MGALPRRVSRHLRPSLLPAPLFSPLRPFVPPCSASAHSCFACFALRAPLFCSYDVWLGDGSTKQVGEDELILGKTWKLNAERNNGRAAMMGITGMLIHESLTGNPVFPLGETL